ncbi:DNA polymerase III subunit chi [Shimia ponticola]|uniref:DNA polymerase III subunit chi n=1 Tax=Shimia ponticola TaxID=2582893 RepID=UPI0011BE26BE|nr:DNA polymerase III subunit chi [Shimia ponticola]
MGAAYFYHLTRSPVEETLPMLLDKARGAGWRIVVKGADLERLKFMDEKLWLGPEDGFVPHGLAGGAHDADQPILLTQSDDWPNNPQCVMALDGADVDADAVNRLDRVCILFDGADGSAVQRARGQWKSLTGAGCAAQYWSQESGRWEKKAESGA